MRATRRARSARFLVGVAVLLVASTIAPAVAAAQRVTVGADRLFGEFAHLIRGRRLALVANHSARLADGTHLADALHALSPRRHMPLVKVNCAAMVEELLLSELFGHEKGAFTGAIKERKGRFEMADGGTIFLDEIGDISPKAQVALLRVLQEREFERVGGSKTIKIDVRIICATNRDPRAEVEAGRFREDLFYRLHVIPLALPPLRERERDALEIAQHFLEQYAREENKRFAQMAPDVQSALLAHSWPGNVRELQNVMRNIVVLHDGELVTMEMLPPLIKRSAAPAAVVPAPCPPDWSARACGAMAAAAGRATAAPPRAKRTLRRPTARW